MAEYYRSELAKKAKLNIATLRYYEKAGLLSIPARTDKGYRLYTDETLILLNFIKSAKAAGFSLNEIKRFFSVDLKADSSDILHFIDQKKVEIDNKITELVNIKEVLDTVQSNLNTEQCPTIKSFIYSITK